VETLNWSLALEKMIGSTEEKGRLAKVFMRIPLALIYTFSPKFGRLGIISGLVVEEVLFCNFCFTSIFVAVAMAKKATYKKRRGCDCTTDYKLFTR
jgi:hypothetical protein